MNLKKIINVNKNKQMLKKEPRYEGTYRGVFNHENKILLFS